MEASSAGVFNASRQVPRNVISTARPSSTTVTMVCRVKNCRRNDRRNTCKQAAKFEVFGVVSMFLFRAGCAFHQVVEHRLGRGVGSHESMHTGIVPGGELAELSVKPARVLHLEQQFARRLDTHGFH